MKLAMSKQEHIIENIYRTRSVRGQYRSVHELRAEIDPEEGEFLTSIIRNDPAIVRTLEIGCGHGLSSLHICLALRGRERASHIIVDPYPYTSRPGGRSWDGAGIAALAEAEIDFFRLLEMKSEFALPRLLEQNESRLDLILIDGWHTFDHTMLDCFYATRLLRVGGVLIIDDLQMPSVRSVVEFLKKYPCYREQGSVVGVPPKVSHGVASWPSAFGKLQIRRMAKVAAIRLLDSWLIRKLNIGKRLGISGTRMIALRKVEEDRRGYRWHAAL